MNNTKDSEQILFMTALLECEQEDKSISRGTGMYFRFFDNGNGESHLPVIITNKHVVDGSKRIFLNINTLDSNGNFSPGNHVSQEIFDLKFNIIDHPNSDVDLCAILIGPTISAIQNTGKQTHIIALNKSHIISKEELASLNTLEEIIMIGYPTGLSDTFNNLPIIRKGITATPAFIDYNNQKEFLIDAPCFPGSSGSPVILFKKDLELNGSTLNERLKMRLLGNLYAGPVYEADGSIITETLPTSIRQFSRTQLLINLGNVIKSERILELEQPILKRLGIA